MTHPRPAVVFRADASHDLGFGHIARLFAVIEEAAAAGIEPIAMLGGDDAVAAWAYSHGIAASVGVWTDGDLFAAAADPRVRAVVIDGPALAGSLAPTLVAHGVRTVVVDDLGDVALPVDAVVNHNFHAPDLAPTYPAAQLCLLGRRYLMLRHAVRRYTRGSCRPGSGAQLRVAVTFGASDPVGATARTLRMIPPDRPTDLIVIAGPAFHDTAALGAAASVATAAGHTVEIVRGSDDIGRLFIGADAAICSAGGTLGELAYLGCPALAFAIVPDQIAPAYSQACAGLISGGHAWSDLTDDDLRAELGAFLTDDQLRHDQRQRALATADGTGARRIVAEALG